MTKLSRLSITLFILVSLLWPASVFAAVGLTGVEPRTVSNQSATTLVVRGVDFQNGAVVVVEGYGALETDFVSAAVLTAILPIGVPAGTYAVTVINPDATSATLASALTVAGPTATSAPTGTAAPTAFVRPLITVQSYGASSVELASYEDLDFEITLLNSGQSTATNVSATFVAGDLIARQTGGIHAVGTLGAGQSSRFFQPLTTGNLLGKNIATMEVRVSYTDQNGTAYNDTFTLTFAVAQPDYSAAATRTPTPTAPPSPRPQLLVTNYSVDVAQLQPGLKFNLSLQVQNVGTGKAKGVTLIAGGGTSSGGGSTGGTPQPGGGVSGAGGEFTNFAPVESSNIQFLGDVESGASFTALQKLIVNATTKAGAYTMKISFTYVDDKGASFTDDQVITLLVYQPPIVQMSFYRETGPLFVGQPNQLPLQVVNLSRGTALLGTLKVSAAEAQLSNNTVLIGALDPGFPFTLDAMLIPDHPGPYEVVLTLDYTDDFNQVQTITQTIAVEVLDGGGVIDPGGGGPVDPGIFEPPPPEPETLPQMIWRFIRGLLGLDSGVTPPGGAPVAPGEFPPPDIQIVPPKG